MKHSFLPASRGKQSFVEALGQPSQSFFWFVFQKLLVYLSRDLPSSTTCDCQLYPPSKSEDINNYIIAKHSVRNVRPRKLVRYRKQSLQKSTFLLKNSRFPIFMIFSICRKRESFRIALLKFLSFFFFFFFCVGGGGGCHLFY